MRFLSTVPGLAVLLAAVLLAACGGSSGGPVVASAGGHRASPTPSAPADPAQLYTRVAACLRQHGANEPDPTIDDKGNPQWQVKIDTIPAAQRQPCQALLQQASGRLAGPPDAATMAAYQRFSACMRQHGVPNFPDPDPAGGDANIAQAGIDPKAPQVQQAFQQCRPLLPNGAG